MAAIMAATVSRSILTVRSSTSYLCFSKRLFSSSSSLAKAPPIPGFVRSVRSTGLISHSVGFAAPAAIRLNQIWCRVSQSGVSTYSSFNSGSNISDRPPEELRFPGCDFEHWLIVLDKPGCEGATKQQLIDRYIQTLAKVLGSEEEAKKKIYSVGFERYFGFGCEIDQETSNKFKGLPGVRYVIPDSYVDKDNKDYGGELFVNGQIVRRPRKKKVYSVPVRVIDRPRYDDPPPIKRRRWKPSGRPEVKIKL